MTTEQLAGIDEGTAPQEQETQPVKTEQEPVAAQEAAPVLTDEQKAAKAQEAVQKRINKITAEKYGFKTEADKLRQENEQLRAATPAPINTGEPTLEAFDFDDTKYQSALIDYKVNQGINNFQAQQTQQQEQAAQQAVASTYNQKVAEFEAHTPDFQEKLSQLPLGNQSVVDAIMQADNGPAIAYHLANHLDIADALQSANPIQAAMMIGQLSATVSATVPKNNITAAPAPVEALNSGGSVQEKRKGPAGATFT
jgi:hypothetical protein